jgi:alpha,alpha-trehalose phosphorylase
MDIEDLKRNTKDGLHTAAMAGSWLALVYGVAGYRLKGKTPSFRPHLPKGWSRLTFSLQFDKVSLKVEIGERETSYRAQGGEIEIFHRSERIKVGPSGVKLPTQALCKAVLFDLDGVVTSTDEYHYQAWKKLANQEGWSFDREVNQRLRGVSRLESLNIILDHNQVTLSEEEKFKLTEIKNGWYRQSLESLSGDDLLPNIGELIEELRERGIKLAIASASQSAPYIVEKLGLSQKFDLVVPAHEILKGKPDPEIFAKAAQMLGLYPEECTGIEDAPAGIEALREAMMRVVGVGSAVDPNLCDVYVEDTSQLRWEELLF